MDVMHIVAIFPNFKILFCVDVEKKQNGNVHVHTSFQLQKPFSAKLFQNINRHAIGFNFCLSFAFWRNNILDTFKQTKCVHTHKNRISYDSFLWSTMMKKKKKTTDNNTTELTNAFFSLKIPIEKFMNERREYVMNGKPFCQIKKRNYISECCVFLVRVVFFFQLESSVFFWLNLCIRYV